LNYISADVSNVILLCLVLALFLFTSQYLLAIHTV